LLERLASSRGAGRLASGRYSSGGNDLLFILTYLEAADCKYETRYNFLNMPSLIQSRDKCLPTCFFLATSHTKNTISEKTNKHTIQLIYPKKRYEHTLFLKLTIIAFTHKNNKNNKKRKNTHVFFFVFQIFLCVHVCKIVNT